MSGGYNQLSDRDEYGEGGLLMDNEVDDYVRDGDSGNGHYVAASGSPYSFHSPAERSFSAGSGGLRSRGSGGMSYVFVRRAPLVAQNALFVAVISSNQPNQGLRKDFVGAQLCRCSLTSLVHS